MEVNPKEENIEPLGTYLKRKREEKRLSLREVEKKSNGKISNSYLCQIENGKVLHPGIHNIFLLCDIYKISKELIMRKLLEEYNSENELCPSCGILNLLN